MRVHACGLNPVDWKIAATGVPQWSWPHIPGLDIVGTVTDAGPGADETLVGRLVAVHHDLTRQGGLAEAAVVAAAAAAVLPAGTDPVLAATAPCPGLTAWQAVQRTGIGPGDEVLVIGAAGAVGTFATQLAASREAAGLTAVVGPDDLARAGALGAGSVLNYRDGSLADILDGTRYDVILDLVGGSTTADAGSALRYGGRLASVARPQWGCAPFTTAPTLVELALGAVYSEGTADDLAVLAGVLADLVGSLDRGELQPPIHAVGDLADAPELLAAMADGTGQKAVIRITAE